MKKTYLLPILGVIILVLILIKVLSNSKEKKNETVNPVIQVAQAECVIAKDTLIDFSYNVVGNIRANESVKITSELSLRLISIHFKEGSRVNKGELLFQLDDSEWSANIKKVKAKLDLARQTEKRNESMLATGGLSQQAFDESVSNRKVLEAEEESLNVVSNKAKIRAPFSGTIGIRNVSEGAFITPGTELTTLDDLSKLKLDFTVPEKYSGMIQKGDKISFRIEGNPTDYYAVVDAINPSVDVSTGNLRILAIVDNSDNKLKAGKAVKITLVSRAVVPSLYLPTQALIPTTGGYHIYVLSGGKAKYQKIATGMRSETFVEITDGVASGDSVLVTGFMKVSPDSKVKIIKVW